MQPLRALKSLLGGDGDFSFSSQQGGSIPFSLGDIKTMLLFSFSQKLEHCVTVTVRTANIQIQVYFCITDITANSNPAFLLHLCIRVSDVHLVWSNLKGVKMCK